MATYNISAEQLKAEGILNSFEIPAGGGSFSNIYSVDFDGVDDYVDCGNPSNLNFSADDAFSFSIWFKKASSGTVEVAFSKALGSGNFNGYMMYFSGNLLYFRLRDSNINFHQIRDNTIHPLNTWVHYVVTYDGSRTGSGLGLTLYKDGTKLTNVQRSGNFNSGTGQSTADFEIGARSNGSARYFDGLIDEVAIFNSELSQSDVTAIYNGGTPNDISALNPLSWWRMGDNNGGTGITVTDEGSGGNNGTMINGPTFETDVPS